MKKGISKHAVYKRVMVFATLLLFVAGALTPIIKEANATDDFDWAWSSGSGTTGDLYRTGNVSIGTSSIQTYFKTLIQGDPKGVYVKTADNTYEAIVGQCHHQYRPAGFVLENRYPASASFPKGVMMRFKGMDTNGVMQEYLAFIAEYVTRTAGAIDGDCWIRPVKNGGANWAFRFTHDGKLLIKDGGVATDTPGAALDVEVSSGGAATIGNSGCVTTNSYAIAMGYNSTASGVMSTAMGYYSTASGDVSTAMGYNTVASGDYGATAMGYNTVASGDVSTAMGYETAAFGIFSTAMGGGTNASLDYATAMGYYTDASGIVSTAMGFETVASGGMSTAMGYQTTASGWGSTALGSNVTVSGSHSIGIGLSNASYTVSDSNVLSVMGGNVGIGTTSPGATLDVSGGVRIINPSDSTDYLSISSGSSSTSLTRVTNGGTLGSVSIDASGTLSAEQISSFFGITAETGNLLVSNGNAGIGTNSPDEKFEVEWVSGGTDAEIGRGTTDTDITFIALRNENGQKCYIYPNAAGNDLVVTTTHP